MPGPHYGYGGYANIGTAGVFIQPGAQVDRPRNLNFPYPVGNLYGTVNFAEGVRFPVMRIPIVAMAGYFTAANLNTWFLTRGGSAPYDTTAITGGVEFADVSFADAQYKMIGAKGAGFSFNFRFGTNPLILNAEFHGTDFDTASGAQAIAGGLTPNPLTFADVTFGGATFGTKGAASNGIIGGSIQYSNGLTPNETLQGQHYPIGHNADIPSASLTIQMYADDAYLPPGYTNQDDYTEITDCTVNVKIAGAPTYTTFSFTKLVLNNPNARQLMQGRGIRNITYNGIANTTTRPLVVSAT